MLIQSNLKKSAQIALLLALFGSLSARDLRKELSNEEFLAAGLNKLTASEIAELEKLLDRQPSMRPSAPTPRAAVAESSPEWVPPEAQTNAKREVVETTFTEEFRGFFGKTEITLSNGQVWRQTDNSVSGSPPRDNRVRIKPAILGRWLLQLRGTNQSYPVKRIK